jgi:hypothetical protein
MAGLMPDRDWAGEMRAHIDAMLDGCSDGYSRGDVERLLGRLRREDPKLVDGWLYAQASAQLWEMVGQVSRSTRAHVRRVSLRRKFAEAVEAHAAGDRLAVPRWLETQYPDGAGNRLPLGKLHAPELARLAETYARSAKAARMQAAFLRAIAQQIGSGTVEQRYSDSELDALYHRIHTA